MSRADSWIALSLTLWLVPTVVLLIVFALMRDEPGGPDWWMAPSWPFVVAWLVFAELRERVRRGPRP